MLEVRGIENGIVLDHITAGNGQKVFNKLFPNKIEHPVVLLMNVESKHIGRKDIIKIENTTDIDLTFLGLLDEKITVNFIKEGKVVKKEKVVIPEQIKGLIQCENPRCITNSDIYAVPTFHLIGKNGNLEYSCEYCEEITIYKL